MKKCPYCAEEIKDEAKVCPPCGRTQVAKAMKEHPGAVVVGWIIAIVFAAIVLFIWYVAFYLPSLPLYLR